MNLESPVGALLYVHVAAEGGIKLSRSGFQVPG